MDVGGEGGVLVSLEGMDGLGSELSREDYGCVGGKIGVGHMIHWGSHEG